MLEPELIEKCRQKQPKAQQALYHQYSAYVFGICLRYTKNRTDAEDVLQECFIRIFQNISSYRGEGVLMAWIRSVCVRTALNFLQKQRRMVFDYGEEVRDELIAVEEDLFSTEDLLVALQQLPEIGRTIFNLFEIEGYSHDEIAELIDLTPLQSRVYLHRAKKALQNYLNTQIK